MAWSFFDVGDPANPESLGTLLQYPAFAERIIVSGDYAYVSGDSMRIYSLENPSAPEQVGVISAGGIEVEVANGYLYVGGASWLRVFSLADPASPELVGSCALGAYMNDLAITGNYAYVADMQGGLRIIDVSNPAHPVAVNCIWESTWRVATSGNTLISHGENGLRVWDITDPLDLSLVGYYATDEWLRDMDIAGSYVLTVSLSRLVVYQCDALSDARSRKEGLPRQFALYPCYPNPFNPSTVIRFSLPRTEHATLIVYDSMGRQVKVLADGVVGAGEHSVMFEGAALPSGVYFARLEGVGMTRTQKLVLLR
jgi:hypothetical protein